MGCVVSKPKFVKLMLENMAGEVKAEFELPISTTVVALKDRIVSETDAARDRYELTLLLIESDGQELKNDETLKASNNEIGPEQDGVGDPVVRIQMVVDASLDAKFAKNKNSGQFLKTMHDGGVPLTEFVAHGLSIKECQTAGFNESLERWKEAGFTLCQCKEGGFSMSQCRKASFEEELASVKACIEAGFELSREYREAGFSIREIFEGKQGYFSFNCDGDRINGYRRCKAAGFSARECKQANLLSGDEEWYAMKRAWGLDTIQSYLSAGYSIRECREKCHKSLSDFKRDGCSKAQFREAGFDSREIEKLFGQRC